MTQLKTQTQSGAFDYCVLVEDSDLFAKNVGFIKILDRELFLSLKTEQIHKILSHHGAQLVSVQIEAGDHALLHAVQSHGFVFIDCRTAMVIADLQTHYAAAPYTIRDAVAEDYALLATIARESFHDGRFVADIRIDQNLAAKRYEKIITQCLVAREKGDAVWVLGEIGAPEAFMALNIKAEHNACELKLAASTGAKGMGTLLFRNTLLRLRAMGISKVQGQIGPGNTAITNVYIKLGFRISPLQCMFHLHLEERV